MASRELETFEAILEDYGVVLIPTNARVHAPRQTRASRVLEGLYRRQGPNHLRDVLASILESENNGMALREPVIIAVSRLLLRHKSWWEADASRWLDVFDKTNLVELHEHVKGNQGANTTTAGLVQELYRRLAARFGEAKEERLL